MKRQVLCSVNRLYCRYVPRRPDGTWPTMQQREGAWGYRSPLEALLARNDEAAIDYVTDGLLGEGDLSNPPPVVPQDASDPRALRTAAAAEFLRG